jgi:hypothetical protein
MKFRYSSTLETKDAVKNLNLYVKNGTNFYSEVICSRRQYGEWEEGLRNRPYIEKELLIEGHISKDGLIEFYLSVKIKDTSTGSIEFFKLDDMDLKKAVDVFNNVLSVDDFDTFMQKAPKAKGNDLLFGQSYKATPLTRPQTD